MTYTICTHTHTKLAKSSNVICALWRAHGLRCAHASVQTGHGKVHTDTRPCFVSGAVVQQPTHAHHIHTYFHSKIEVLLIGTRTRPGFTSGAVVQRSN
eukprot:1150838-Pelagomonas_calceolata.AAC.2